MHQILPMGLSQRVRPPASLIQATSVLIIAALLAACANSGGSSAGETQGVTKDQVLFGQTVPYSGPSAHYGESTAGIDAYFASVNAKGGVDGRKLKIIGLDDQYQAPIAVQQQRKLLTEEKIFAAVGTSGTPTTQAVLPLLTRDNVALVGPQTGASSFFKDPPKNLFLVWPSYNVDGELMGKFALDKLGLKRIGVIELNNDAGKSVFEGVKAAGVTPVMTIPFDPDQQDFASAVQKLKSAKADGVIIIATPVPAVAILNAMADANYKPERLLTSFSLTADGFTAAKRSFPGSYLAAFVPPLTDTSNPQVQSFLAAMKKYQPNKPASTFAAWGWMEAQVAVAGLQGVKGSLTRQSYLDALGNLKNVETLGGSVSYGPNDHIGLDKMFMLQAENDKFVSVKS